MRCKRVLLRPKTIDGYEVYMENEFFLALPHIYGMLNINILDILPVNFAVYKQTDARYRRCSCQTYAFHTLNRTR